MIEDEDRIYPRHGSRNRYRKVGCRCVACTRGPHGVDIPERLTWPYRWLDRKAGTQVELWFGEEQVQQWRSNGMDDYEADRVCIAMGLHPASVFPGYLEAGMDCDVYP